MESWMEKTCGKIIRGQGALAPNLWEHKPCRDRCEGVNDFRRIFVAQDCEKNGCALVTELFPPGLCENPARWRDCARHR